VAALAWEGIVTGTIELPSGKTLTLSPHDWLDFYKWIFSQIDGPPKQQHEVAGVEGRDLIPDRLTTAVGKIYGEEDSD
jgi:hypothetical protein